MTETQYMHVYFLYIIRKAYRYTYYLWLNAPLNLDPTKERQTEEEIVTKCALLIFCFLPSA